MDGPAVRYSGNQHRGDVREDANSVLRVGVPDDADDQPATFPCRKREARAAPSSACGARAAHPRCRVRRTVLERDLQRRHGRSGDRLRTWELPGKTQPGTPSAGTTSMAS